MNIKTFVLFLLTILHFTWIHCYEGGEKLRLSQPMEFYGFRGMMCN